MYKAIVNKDCTSLNICSMLKHPTHLITLFACFQCYIIMTIISIVHKYDLRHRRVAIQNESCYVLKQDKTLCDQK